MKNYRKKTSALLVAAAAFLVVALTAAPKASAIYILSGVEPSAIVIDSKSKTAPVIDSQFVNISSGSRGHDLRLKAGQLVTITYHGNTVTCQSRSENISTLLRRMEIEPSPLDMIAVDVSEQLVAITVASDVTLYEHVDEPAPFETIRRPNPSMKKGEEKVVQEGINGVRSAVYEVTWSNGQVISRQFVEKLDSTAQDKIIEYGTAVTLPKETLENIHSPIANVQKNADGSGTLTLTTGEVLSFSAVKNMKATAYTTGYDGVGTRTATGTRVHRGSVAVDRRYIPLGTKMYIVTSDGSYVYGLSVAEDTGNVGKNLDLFHDTYEQCINFGRRGVTVYFLD